MRRVSTVLGISDHNGWAVLVAVAARGGEPVIVDRRRVELVDARLAKQPYHEDAAGLELRQAEQLVCEVRESAAVCSERALATMGAQAIALREPPLPAVPSVSEALARPFVNNRADAMLYHDALCTAAKRLGIAVHRMARGEERGRAAAAMKTSEERLERWLEGLREKLGAPWQKDHRDAAARAIAALGATRPLEFPV